MNTTTTYAALRRASFGDLRKAVVAKIETGLADGSLPESESGDIHMLSLLHSLGLADAVACLDVFTYAQTATFRAEVAMLIQDMHSAALKMNPSARQTAQEAIQLAKVYDPKTNKNAYAQLKRVEVDVSKELQKLHPTMTRDLYTCVSAAQITVDSSKSTVELLPLAFVGSVHLSMYDKIRALFLKHFTAPTNIPHAITKSNHYVRSATINTERNSGVRNTVIGDSDYAQHKIQVWDIWLEYKLNPFRADILKRILRTKSEEDTKLDFQKIKHVCDECIRQIEAGEYKP